jgi:hypothetical protein
MPAGLSPAGAAVHEQGQQPIEASSRIPNGVFAEAPIAARMAAQYLSWLPPVTPPRSGLPRRESG